MTKNYYKILGVDKDAEASDIKKAYRNLSMEHHPDKGGDTEKFKEINEAYSVLSDPAKRAQYDNPQPDLLRGFNFPGSPFGRPRRPNPNAPRKGRTIQLVHEAPVHLFILGGDLKVKVGFDDVCKECNGQGATEFNDCTECGGTGMITSVKTGQGVHIQSSGPCPACRGRGRSPINKCDECGGRGSHKTEKEVVLPISPGFRDGQVAGAAGEGGSGLNGGPPGDLIVKLRMKYPNPDELTDEQKELLEEL